MALACAAEVPCLPGTLWPAAFAVDTKPTATRAGVRRSVVFVIGTLPPKGWLTRFLREAEYIKLRRTFEGKRSPPHARTVCIHAVESQADVIGQTCRLSTQNCSAPVL